MFDPDKMTDEERYRRVSQLGTGLPGMGRGASTEQMQTETAMGSEDELDHAEVEILERIEETDADDVRLVNNNQAQLVALSDQPPPIDSSLPESVRVMIEGISARLEPKLNIINENVGQIGSRVQVLETRVIKNNDNFKKVADYALKTRGVVKDNRRKVKNLDAKVDSNMQKVDQRFNEMRDYFSEKMIEVEDIIKRYEEGGFGDFTDLEKPTRKDHYDFMKSFNMSKNSIGFFPVYKADIAEMMRNLTCNEKDALRISISQFLRLEMGFTSQFVVHIEQHYVAIHYDGRDTAYVIFDHIDMSGGRRIWQEAGRLTRHNHAGRQTPELRVLEVPQLRERKRALERFANSLRYGWKEQNPDAPPNVKLRTRVLESKDGSYDFIVQQQLPGEKYKKVELPEDLELPKVQWKVKTYIGHTSTQMMPRTRESILVRDFIPQGRQSVHIPVSNPPPGSAIGGFTMHVINETYKYVPGVIDPGSPEEKSLDRASHLGSGKTPLSMIDPTVDQQTSSMPSQQSLVQDGAGAAVTGIGQQHPGQGQQLPASVSSSGQQYPPLRRPDDPPQPTPEEWSKEEERKKKEENDRIIKEQQEQQRLLTEAREREEAVAKLKADAEKRQAEINQIIESNRQQELDHIDHMDRLDQQLENIRREETEKEEKRFDEDIERRRIAAELAADEENKKQERKERADRERKDNPQKDLISDVDEIDLNRNQENNSVISPPPPRQTGTRKRKIVKVNKRPVKASGTVSELWRDDDDVTDQQLAEAASDVTLNPDLTENYTMSDSHLAGNSTVMTVDGSQPTIGQFFPKRSSTILDDHVETDTDTENFESADEDSLETPERQAAGGNPSLLRETLVKKLDFNSKNYEFVNVTPSGAEYRSDSNVTVRTEQRPEVIGERIVTPTYRAKTKKILARYEDKQPTSKIPMRSRSNSQSSQRSRSNSLGPYQKPDAGTKRGGSGEDRDKDKVNRVKSPPSKELLTEEEAAALLESDQDSTKQENITIGSDLSSLSVLPDDSGIAAALNNADTGDTNSTLDETVILAAEETNEDNEVNEASDVTGNETLVNNTAGGVTIVKDYDSDDKTSPDKRASPEPDHTGHMTQVQAVANQVVIDSGDIALEGVMSNLSKPLIAASTSQVTPPNTEQKKLAKEEVD